MTGKTTASDHLGVHGPDDVAVALSYECDQVGIDGAEPVTGLEIVEALLGDPDAIFGILRCLSGDALLRQLAEHRRLVDTRSAYGRHCFSFGRWDGGRLRQEEHGLSSVSRAPGKRSCGETATFPSRPRDTWVTK
jgi:hypothetical protein